MDGLFKAHAKAKIMRSITSGWYRQCGIYATVVWHLCHSAWV